ncbi:MAG: hypothetical protein GXY50_09810 [Syntrophomonadaceae bacterium]|nr:hypothetical protein [Syntrophomonadaceae bacterium]
MIRLLNKLLRINLRVIILTLLLLVLFDVALQQAIIPYYLDSNRSSGRIRGTATAPAIKRLPADDANTLSLWKAQLAEEQGFTVVFLGDSIDHGGGVAAEHNTLPAFFSQRLSLLYPEKDIKVFNFSLPGCTPADTYNILSFIADIKPDLVIYDVNMGWFGTKNEMEHPLLAELTEVEEEHSPPLPLPAKALTGAEIEKILTSYATDYWSLYRNRIFLNYVWFGKPLAEHFQIKTTAEELDTDAGNLLSDEEIYKPWYLKDFDDLKKAEGKLGHFTLDEHNPHWGMYNRLLEKLAQENINSVFFMIPRNRTLYEKYNLLDEKVLNDQQEILAAAARKYGAVVYDYTFAVNDLYFTDSVHLTAEGNRDLAYLLVADIVEDNLMK